MVNDDKNKGDYSELYDVLGGFFFQFVHEVEDKMLESAYSMRTMARYALIEAGEIHTEAFLAPYDFTPEQIQAVNIYREKMKGKLEEIKQRLDKNATDLTEQEIRDFWNIP